MESTVDIRSQLRYNLIAGLVFFSSTTLYCKRPIPLRFWVFWVCLFIEKGLSHFILVRQPLFLLYAAHALSPANLYFVLTVTIYFINVIF